MPASPQLESELARRVHERTGGQVRGLEVVVAEERVTLRGHAATYYVKQLAQTGVLDVLPQARLDNAIEVDGIR